ncbi:MAG TPA: Gfo/Idh/MocA family oxidoreductase [Amaricoccus sp.]|uniref:Gfo/Idh/MocA family protein n=1 Tax=Amaricoccus sp. TaxID=1872485 RepID=UPI002CF28142|nr:Gfo/Idh/MocA family oxidoreductase [Amaricoccus sp.]HMQ94718.1 Gfo/Idh/MocA family oxidoreductase [Amaricoccus sp.]HMR52351.1 Gfo/Idh/MocA family oxidoreductase [Amaricoccus sp.]HMR60169.1 Gfo/Idh/MocA family oxidoreductase [Amaricoccus sp.]HMT99272.1 Gfo/Idh/MocA family oxidoreductase [Amaricoccus sp.]
MQGLGVAVVGIDHDHILGMLGNMLKLGADCRGWWTEGHPTTEAQFLERFGEFDRVADRRALLDDASVDLVLIAAVPADRAALAIEAMEAGKDVMVDKPGCTTLEQLAALRACVARTGRIWSVNFSERFEVPAVTRADELVRAGAIGRVIQTVGLGPHRQRLHTRPEWYFDKARFGGILCDIGSHQVDQFLHFTGSTEVEVAHALAENSTRPEYPGFEDFGEIVLNGDAGHGYIRVDWFTPDALPAWGDGRLFILGDEGSIELRKYVDLARSETGNHLLLSNRTRVEHIDCRDAGLPYFPRLAGDIRDRTETAVAQEHTFRTMKIAIRAQMKADARLRPGG